MFKILTHTKVLSRLLPLALLAMTNSNADPMIFSYTFAGTNPGQVYAPGSVLIGQIDGTIDPMDPNRVIVNSFGPVSLLRPGFPQFNYPPIANNEFNTFPSGNTPVMTFDGSEIDFRACPSGFTSISPDTLALDDCPFALEGGFLVETVVPFDPMGFATAADGSGAAGTALCGVSGCRVTDRPLVGVWSLAVLPDAGQVIYGAAHLGPEGESTLYRINPVTGAATAVGSGIGFQRVSGMDFDPTTGILYATGEREEGFLDVNVLMTINPSTGVGTEIGPTGVVDFAGVFSGSPGFPGVFSDLSFRPTDNTLFGFSFPGQWVATIDLATGDATQLAFETVIGDRGILANAGNALAFVDSVLVHAGSHGENITESPLCAPNCFSALHEIDLGTNMVTTSVALDFPVLEGFDNDIDVPRANGMDFHSASEKLFASIIYGFSGGGATFLGTIDTLGNVDLIGETKLGMDALTVITSVDIDIKPGSNPNSINPGSNGVIPVAILTTSTADGDALDFDATQVDATTLAFGPDGAGIAHQQGHVVDIDEDGIADLVVHFKTKETGIKCGDTETTLTGATFGAEPILGTDTMNTVGCAAACISPPSGLVSWWPGDGNALDIIGPNDGTPLNGATFAPGLVDQAFSFDGVDDFVDTGGTNIGGSQQLTIDAWVKHDSLPSGMIERYVTLFGENEVVLRHDGGNGPGQLHFFMRHAGVLRHIRVNNALQVGVFHHVAGTYDGSAMRLYLDGVEVGSLVVGGTVSTVTSVALSFPVETLDGLLDEVEIHNRALTAPEIAAIFAAGDAGKCK